MTVLTSKKIFLFVLIFSFSSINLFAQIGNVSTNQDPKFEQLLNEKRKVNASITINDRYKIQIFNGDSEASKKSLSDFRKEYKNYDGTIIFSTPTYKVWVGNFKSRIEAERNLLELKKRYTNAFLIKPNK